MEKILDYLVFSAAKKNDESINTKSKESYKKIKKLFNDNRVELKSFEDTALDITDFSWSGLTRDRNWWWQLQGLPFLNWYVSSYSLQNLDERQYFFECCVKAIQNWERKAKESKEAPLVWHDHASAFRLRNLVDWAVFCQLRGICVHQECKDLDLTILIFEHLEWLNQDENYSKNTNHGFDQSMISLTVSLIFQCPQLKPYREVSRKRLAEEVKSAFTEQGVHVENSPGYQKVMLQRLKQLRKFRFLGAQEISKLAEEYIENAEDFLRALTLPDGSLPEIGDTRSGDAGIYSDYPDKATVYDYSKSGYVVIKGKISQNLPYCFIFKCGHLSNYHRHDDDLMVYLNVAGNTVLSDGGLGAHAEKDARRMFLRSVYAHSLPIIKAPFVRDRNRLAALPTIIHRKKECKLIGVSKGYGVKVIREIDYSDIDLGKIHVKDECGKKKVAANWVVRKRPVHFENEVVSFPFEGFNLCVEGSEADSFRIFSGWLPEAFSESAIWSPRYGAYEDCHRIMIGGSDNIVISDIYIEADEERGGDD